MELKKQIRKMNNEVVEINNSIRTHEFMLTSVSKHLLEDDNALKEHSRIINELQEMSKERDELNKQIKELKEME